MRTALNTRMKRPLAVAAAVVLLAGGCGARLTKTQVQALNNSGSGVGAGQGAVNDNGGGTGSGTGAGGSAGAGASGGASPTGPAAGTTGASGASGSSSGSSTGAAGSGGAATGGSAGATGGASSGGSGPGAARGGTGGASGGGSGPVSAASSPLAGPGGKMCANGAPGSGPGVTSSSITVGNIATVNGPVPGLFAGARYGAQAVAAYINSIGGICGRKLVVNSADDQFDQATDQNEAQTMSSQVLAFMGSFSLQDAGIPAGAPGVPDLGEALSSARFSAATNFSPQPEAPGYQTSAYQYFVSNPQYHDATQHMAMLVENTPQTAQTGAWEQAALQSAGFKFTFVDKTLQPTDPTFNGDVQKMKAAGVQGVIFQATGTIIGQLANAMYAAGMKIVLGNYCPAAYDPAYIQNAGPGAAGTVLSQALSLYDGQDANQIPMVATLDQWYGRVNPGQVPDIFAVYSWMSGIMLAQALNEAGSVSRSALQSGLRTLTSFTGDGLSAPGNPVAKTPPTCFVLIDVKNNQFVRDPATPSGFKCSPSGYFHASS